MSLADDSSGGCAKVVWTEKGAAMIFKAEEAVFHLRKDNGKDSYVLLVVGGDRSARS